MTYNLAMSRRIECNGRFCTAFVDGFSIPEWEAAGRPNGTDLAITRVVAKRLYGWETNVPQQRRGARRLDFCPAHVGT